MGKLKEKIIEKGTGLVAKSKSKKQLEKILPKPLAKQISKKIGKGIESVTSTVINLWNKLNK